MISGHRYVLNKCTAAIGTSTAIIFANKEQYRPVYVPSYYKDNPVYTVKEYLQCRWVPSTLQLFFYRSVFMIRQSFHITLYLQ